MKKQNKKNNRAKQLNTSPIYKKIYQNPRKYVRYREPLLHLYPSLPLFLFLDSFKCHSSIFISPTYLISSLGIVNASSTLLLITLAASSAVNSVTSISYSRTPTQSSNRWILFPSNNSFSTSLLVSLHFSFLPREVTRTRFCSFEHFRIMETKGHFLRREAERYSWQTDVPRADVDCESTKTQVVLWWVGEERMESKTVVLC